MMAIEAKKRKLAEDVLAARCACPEFVPNWCCRNDIYFLRMTQAIQEARLEREKEKMRGTG